MSSANRRALVVRMSLLEAALAETRKELNGRKPSKRVELLIQLVNEAETALSNLQRGYFDVTLTPEEYSRIARGLVVMEGIISGSVPAARVDEMVQLILRGNPELRKYL